MTTAQVLETLREAERKYNANLDDSELLGYLRDVKNKITNPSGFARLDTKFDDAKYLFYELAAKLPLDVDL